MQRNPETFINRLNRSFQRNIRERRPPIYREDEKRRFLNFYNEVANSTDYRYVIRYVRSDGTVAPVVMTPHNLKRNMALLSDGFEETDNLLRQEIDESDRYALITLRGISDVTIYRIENQRLRRRRRAGFFPYGNKTEWDLTRYQIFRPVDVVKVLESDHTLAENCLVYTFRLAGIKKEKLEVVVAGLGGTACKNVTQTALASRKNSKNHRTKAQDLYNRKT